MSPGLPTYDFAEQARAALRSTTPGGNGPHEEHARDRIAAALGLAKLSAKFGVRAREPVAGAPIGKTVDAEIYMIADGRAVCAVEVSNVNSPQLIGEIGRLYFDPVPLKLLWLVRGGNTEDRVAGTATDEYSEKILCRFYGQDCIDATPARVTWSNVPDAELVMLLRQLLVE